MSRYSLLETIGSPADLRRLSTDDLSRVSFEIREYIIDTLSNIGGHFASNLGAVELTVALHYVLETPRDKLIWDVGHQTYPHKILTGRREALKRVRRMGGISGFPKREESPYDLYNTGHAGTSISQMLGEAMARDALGLDHACVCVIGDASIASGMAFEALNHGGHAKTDCTVILNDNDMSISQNVGALNLYLNRLITSPFYNRWRKWLYTFCMWLPVIGPAMQLFYRRVEKSFKDFLMPGSLFTDFGFRYFGPVDGHDVKELVEVLNKVVHLKGPNLIHVFTQKGKGYSFAEDNPIHYHAVSVFNREEGMKKKTIAEEQISFSDIVGLTLGELAERNRRVVAITPAMIEGSGLRAMADRFPDRVIDVGIAEQHSMSFAGALASGGMVPFLCIYSTFLTRALDQLVQDVALMKFPVRLVIDRAGCVGPDGETHQGLYDMGFLLAIPNIRIFAPATGGELRAILLKMETDEDGPIAVRFPKASADRSSLDDLPDIRNTAPVLHGAGGNLGIVCIGVMWEMGIEIEREIRNRQSVLSTVIGVRWIRPLNLNAIEKVLAGVERFIIIEDSYENASAAAYIRARLSPEIGAKHLKTYAFPSEAILHGNREEIFESYGMGPAAITADLLSPGVLPRPVIARSSDF